MDEIDMRTVEQLLAKQAEQSQKQIEQLLVKQNEEFKTFVGVLMENTDHKIALVAESHQALHDEIKATRTELKQEIELSNVKIDALNDKIGAVDEKLTKKIDAVSVDLKQHRKDTEAHHNVYCVKES